MREYSAMFDLTSRTALVIGAGSGIGQAAAFGLAAHGAEVTAADLNPGAAQLTAARITSEGGRATSMPMDMREPDSVAAALDRTGAPDVLVITPSINVRKRFFDIDDESFARVVDLNLKGTFRVMREYGRAMAGRGRGSIIVFSSIRAQTVEPGQAVYAATKAGALQLVRTLAAEVGELGVRVNAIAPGVVETPLTQQIKNSPDWYSAYADKSVLKRWAQPSEMVGAVVFLASDASSYVTGSYLLVDGGWTAADGRFTPPL